MAAPKQPQDHKLKAAEAEALKAPFTFIGGDGETYELPTFNPGKIKSGLIRKARHNELELIYMFLEALASPEAIEGTDGLEFEDLTEMFKAWQEAAGAELPK